MNGPFSNAPGRAVLGALGAAAVFANLGCDDPLTRVALIANARVQSGFADSVSDRVAALSHSRRCIAMFGLKNMCSYRCDSPWNSGDSVNEPFRTASSTVTIGTDES